MNARSEDKVLGPVLVVDDDPATLELIGDILETDGLRVCAASEAVGAIELFRTQRPRLVVADIIMPGMDGLDLLAALRSLDPAVPVIMVTAYGATDHAVEALRGGAYDFLQKPVNPHYFLSAVHRALDHYRLKCIERDRIKELEASLEAQTRLRGSSDDLLNGILNSSTGVSIVWTDFDQTVRFWNAGAEQIFGYSSAEMVGSKITVLYPEDTETPDAVETLRRRIQVERSTLQGKIKQRTKSGKLRTVSLVISPMLAPSQDVIGILGIGQDVTEEVRLQEELIESLRRIQRVQSSAIFALAVLAESRDEETGRHLNRIQAFTEVLCKRLRHIEKFADTMTDQFVDDLVQASVLHDIGKVGIPDSILFSKEVFSEKDYETMKQHPITGGKALEDAARQTGEGRSLLSIGMDVAYFHHERWDGTGYPFGRKGEEIPLAARIVSIADVYDALTSKRRYKRAFAHEEALALITEGSSTQFDPDLVEAFREVHSEFQAIRQQLTDTTEPSTPVA
ncbi:MAG: response regulator [Thermodesulfobacteriota bacterium]